MRRNVVYFVLLAVLGTMVTGCMTPPNAYNIMLPADQEFSDDEVATIVIAYPLKPDAFDRIPVPEVGGYDTVLVVEPGVHQLVTHMDTATSTLDRMAHTYTTSYDYFGYTMVETTTDIETYRTYGAAITAYPGMLHFFRVVMSSNDGFRTGMTYGPNPFHAPNGITVTFDPMEDSILVEGADGSRSYSLTAKQVFFSPDGKHLAFISSMNNKWHVVLDGVEVVAPDSLHTAPKVWSMDGSSFAYAAYFKAGAFSEDLYIMINGERYAQVDGVDPGSPIFFDEDDKLVCAIKRGDNWYVKRGDYEEVALSVSEAREMVWAALDEFYEGLK